MNKKCSLFLIFITLFIFILFSGCKNNSVSIYERPAIFAEISRFKDSEDSLRTFVRGNIDGSLGSPDITINNETVGGTYGIQDNVYSGFFAGYISNDPEEEYELVVSHDLGEARAQVTMPASFGITTPQENDTLNIEEDLFISWDPSDNAERYILNVHMEYLDSIDSLVIPRNWIRFDSLVNTTNTSVTIPNETIFPLDPDSVICGSGDILIKSENGPSVRLPLYTSGRNISGNGIGYFVAANYTHYDDNFLYVIIKNDTTVIDYIEESYAEFNGLYGMHYGHAYFDSRLITLYSHDPEFTKFLELQE